MWAMLDYDNETVIACVPPDVDIMQKEIQEEINGRILIKLNLENSPAHLRGKYIDGKFHLPKELING